MKNIAAILASINSNKLTQDDFHAIGSIFSNAKQQLVKEFYNGRSAEQAKGFAAEFFTAAEFNIQAVAKGADVRAILPDVAGDGKQHIADLLIVHKDKIDEVQQIIRSNSRLNLPEDCVVPIQIKVGALSYLKKSLCNKDYESLQFLINTDSSDKVAKFLAENPDLVGRVKSSLNIAGINTSELNAQQFADYMKTEDGLRNVISELESKAEKAADKVEWKHFGNGLAMAAIVTAGIQVLINAPNLVYSAKQGYFKSESITVLKKTTASAGETSFKFVVGQGARKAAEFGVKKGFLRASTVTAARRAGVYVAVASVVYDTAKDANKVRKGKLTKYGLSRNLCENSAVAVAGTAAGMAFIASGGWAVMGAGIAGATATKGVCSLTKHFTKKHRRK